MNEKVLLYQLKGTETGKKLQMVLLRMGIRIKVVEPEEYDVPIGLLAGMKEIEPIIKESSIDTDKKCETSNGEDNHVTSVDIREPMVVMCGFSGNRVDELLGNMRRAGVPKIGLKAMLTPTNLQWNSRQLYLELKKEHEAMQALQNK